MDQYFSLILEDQFLLVCYSFLTNTKNINNFIKNQITTMEFGIFELFKLVGSLGLFIYGMKIMSEGIQKFAGNKMRELLGKMTNNKFAGIFTGFLTTSVIQSSSATTVMVVSFVNAGLLNLKQAIGVIMGANIGTTMHFWFLV